ncbi:ribonuclease P/MRP protein subunit POP5 isoform X2 [Gracilinanus agilis]|uniref:ribonuclease P/MRP protein subunit POP5 isoform X2 n=1 Tax=Gracilinanus agilis TaxID=191870 RepID=UPI001CFC5863|nr:ribonuclease P/MRP protein subunit POP5 isoform X2 [Gracilinanus agilis]
MVRFKHRYLLCELVFEDPRCRACLEERILFSLVRDAIARAHGAFGAAACALAFTVKYLNAYTGVVLLRCRKEFYQLLWSALPFITYLENKGQRYPCFFNTLHVGEERESIKKSVMSCSLEEQQEDELSGSGSEEDATEME